jgi:hypothetical protein
MYDLFASFADAIFRRRPSFWKQCRLLTWRSAVDTIRNPAVLKLRLIQKIVSTFGWLGITLFASWFGDGLDYTITILVIKNQSKTGRYGISTQSYF